MNATLNRKQRLSSNSIEVMLKMAGAFALLFLCFVGIIGGSEEESVELLRLSSTDPSQLPLAVTLPTQQLKKVSSSVIEAETWLRIHVLSRYPASKITHIAVGHNLLCSSLHRHQFASLVLPSLKNLHYSLTRWGLEKEIKISPSISSKCLEKEEDEEDLDETLVKPLLEFVQTINSSLLVNPTKPSSEISGEVDGLRNFGPLDIKVVLHEQIHTKPNSRKLSSSSTMPVDPYPARPTPLPELSPSSSIHVSFPANVAKSPLPPLIGSPIYFPPLIPSKSPPPSSPRESPVVHPAPPPFGGFHLPPCNPAPAPGFAMGGEKLWCVAKPSVPVDTLQDAIDFACGEGEADCDEIQPDGSCYNPDTVIAHASYAFNSYWQKTKRHGGTCGFGGTAMLINADPSFLNCKFVVS